MSDETELSREERTKIMQMCHELTAQIFRDGESAETRVRLANLHLKLGEREEAIMSLQIALNQRPGTAAILAKLRQVCTEEEFAKLELPEKIEPFWRDMSGLFRYPLGGSGVYLLVGGTVFITVLQYIIGLPTFFFWVTGMVAIFLAGYMSSYFISIMKSSASGRKTPPDWPDITNVIGVIAHSLFSVSFPMFVSFFPVAVYAVFVLFFQAPPFVLFILIGFGLLYSPMALIASAITGAPLNSANFIGIINSIRKVRKEYLIAELILAFFVVVSVVAYIMVKITTRAMAGAFIAGFAVQFVNLYFMMIFAHILGLLYRQCESRINS